MAVGMLERVRRFFALEESDSYSISSSSIEALQQHPQMSAPVRQMNRSNIVNLPLRRPEIGRAHV